MKKIIIYILLLLIPLNVFAYSNEILLGGNTLGINIKSDGVLIIGFYEINGSLNKGNPRLKVGDYIIKVNDVSINSLEQLTSEIEKYVSDNKVKLTYRRNNKIGESYIDLIKEGDTYKTGLYVKDSIIGIGSLTYIDLETKIYGALGHEIIESSSSEIVEIKSGEIFRNSIIGIDKSKIGYAGSKNAKYYKNTIYGNITKNTRYGIFGIYDKSIDSFNKIEVGSKDEILIGEAYLYTVLDKENVSKYKIEIISINDNTDVKNLVFKITDDTLIEKAGGILQGMSGSPIVQNDKIIGVVTHVIVDNPVTGYGLFIETMLEEGEK